MSAVEFAVAFRLESSAKSSEYEPERGKFEKYKDTETKINRQLTIYYRGAG